jgi:hypothetical protein
MMGMPGTCMAGTCNAVPSCYNTAGGFGSSLQCDAGSLSWAQDTNNPAGSTFNPPTNKIGAYACAPMETAPDIAYKFTTPSTGDQDITVSLKPVAPQFVDGGMVVDKDLDLIILDSACTATAPCMNPMLPGGGYQGITAGTANERVRFHATAGKTYYIVVDGKDPTQVTNYRVEIEACGACQPTTDTRLSCNMTMPINGDTSKGSAQLSTYMCGTPATSVSLPGKEQTFFFTTQAPVAENVTATVSGSTTPVTLLALPVNSNGACDPTMCLASSASSTSATLTFSAAPDFGDSKHYWVVVDTPSTTDATYAMSFSCAPYCAANASLDCSSPSTRSVTGNNGGMGSSSLTSQWGPGAGCSGRADLTGPETGISFQTPAIAGTKTFHFELQSNTAGKDLTLVLLDGTKANKSCAPNLDCAIATPSTNGGSSSGSYTTDVANNKTAYVTLNSDGSHYYYAIVDGPNLSAADFVLTVTGDGGSLCPN